MQLAIKIGTIVTMLANVMVAHYVGPVSLSASQFKINGDGRLIEFQLRSTSDKNAKH